MSITKIDDVYLYTDLKWLPNEASDAVDAKNYLDSTDIKYIHLNYADETQHEACLSPLRTWQFVHGTHNFETSKDFPFVIYTEIHDNLSPAFYPRVLLLGLDAIKNSNLVELYSLGR